MSRIVPLDLVSHAGLRFTDRGGAANRQMVQIGLSEVALAAADMPLCVAKDGATGHFNLVAMLGLSIPVNLFSDHGQFQATYLPRAAALSCFRLDPRGVAGLAIDIGDVALGSAGAALIEAGRPAPLLDRIRDALERLVEDVTAARQLIGRFAEHDLIRPLDLVLTGEDGGQHRLDGLYTIDPGSFRDLSDAAVLALHRADAITIAGVLSASLAQFERLRQLHNIRYPSRIASIRFRTE